MAEALRRLGAEVQVLTLARGGFYEARLRAAGLNPLCMGECSNRIVRLATMARLLLKNRPHVIQAGHTYMNAYAAVLGRICRTISIGAVRTNVANMFALHNKLVVRLLMSTTALITNSDRTRAGLIRAGLVPAERVYVVPNAIEESKPVESALDRNATDEEVRVLFLGRLIPGKRVDRFLQALSLARRARPQLVGLIAGDGPERRRAEQLASNLGLNASQATFLGHVEDPQRLLARVDLLVLTSDDIEGSPNAILEGMAAGIPVITTACGNAASLIQDGDSGFVCSFDATAFAEKMVLLSGSSDLRKRMGEASRRRAIACYGSEQLGVRLLNVYRAVARARHDTHVTGLLECA
jgi:glycosyltransferase involved in cell wall biosynthesis